MMWINIVTAWLAVICGVLATLKWIARISGNKTWNQRFFRIHIPVGHLCMIFGLIHGILAGGGLSLLFSFNWGTLLLVITILIGMTYYLKRKWKQWIMLHRVLTVAFFAVLMIHLLDAGILIDNYVKNLFSRQSSVSSTQEGVLFGDATLQDGTYEGSAEGFKGTITVSVQVEGGKVTDIQVVSESDTPNFFSQAESVLDSIIEAQSLSVDTVSGATYSSTGLMNAVADALDDAVIDGDLDFTVISLPEGGHSHH